MNKIKNMLADIRKKPQPPFGYRLEKDGTHTAIFKGDIMTDNGERFYQSFRMRVSVVYDPFIRNFVFDLEEISKRILSLYPSLAKREWKIAF